MKKSRSALKKRSARRKPAKSRSAAARRKSPKKRAVKSRGAAAKRRTGAKRAGAKKTRGRMASKKTARKKTASTAKKRKITTTKKASGRTASPRKPVAPKPVLPAAPAVPANEFKAGVVTHYYSHLSVAVIAVTDRRLQLGDRIHIKGHTSDFYQSVGSMQIEHDTISAADVGQTVGLKVTEHAREHDTVYLVT